MGEGSRTENGVPRGTPNTIFAAKIMVSEGNMLREKENLRKNGEIWRCAAIICMHGL